MCFLHVSLFVAFICIILIQLIGWQLGFGNTYRILLFILSFSILVYIKSPLLQSYISCCRCEFVCHSPLVTSPAVSSTFKVRNYSTDSSAGKNLKQELAYLIIDDPYSQSISIQLPAGCAGKPPLKISCDFIEWFRGFTDAEGCFLVSPNRGSSFTFKFKIKLHIDDVEALNIIQNTLQLGKVRVSRTDPEATLEITVQQEIAVIIAIFSKYNLNTTKHLNFLAFEQAFWLYTEQNSKEARLKLKPEIDIIRGKMNFQRTDFNLKSEHKFNITPNWLLGFSEGDGSFYFEAQKNALVFAIKQKGNLELLNAIKDFLLNLATQDKENGVNVNENGFRVDIKEKGLFLLSVNDKYFMEFVLIPLFDDLTWYSKKYLDYCDWKAISKIFNLGFHYLPEGEALIQRILSQMNNNRLSTSKAQRVDRDVLMSEIDRLINTPSNYEIQEDGKIYIKSLKRYRNDTKPIAVQMLELSTGNVFNSFNSIAACGKFLGVSYPTTFNRVSSGNPFKFKDKLFYLRKVEVEK